MIVQGAGTYQGQMIHKMATSTIEAKEKGEPFYRSEFSMAIPGTEAAASGEVSVFEKVDGQSFEILHQFDSNNDGKINWRENVEMMMALGKPLNGNEGSTEGRVLMRNFSSIEDLKDYLGTEFEGVFSKAEAEAMFERFDLDDDGQISESEMDNAMKEIEAEVKERIEEEIEKEKERISLSSQLAVYDEPAMK